jgi:hypothetical protein
MTAVACGHSSPVAPDAAAAPADAAIAPSSTLAAKPGSAPSASGTATFPLLAGTFTIGGRKGSQISGVYTGETTDGGGISVTTLRLEVTSGTGSLAGAKGILEGTGRGAFTGEGAFALEVSGTLATNAKKRTKFSASLEGTSQIDCDEAGRVIISLHADGPNGTKSSGEMRHQVANAGCGF